MKQKLIALFLIMMMVASALTAVGLATTTTVAAATATHTTLSVSKTTAAINEKVTFTISLKRWNAATSSYVPLAYKSVALYHTFKGVTYTDVTKKTDANGKFTFPQSFGSFGQRVYHAKFAGDSSYVKSTSNGVTVTVKYGTTLTLEGTQVSRHYDPFGHLIWQTLTVFGHLKSKSGKPITGVKVTVGRLVGSTWTYLGSGVTDSTGRYAVPYTQNSWYRGLLSAILSMLRLTRLRCGRLPTRAQEVS